MKECIIRLAIADDHTVLRRSLVAALSIDRHFIFVFEVGTGRELLHKLKADQPDVLLLDIKMPDINGIQALKIIHLEYPNIKVLMLTAFFDEIYIAQCLEFGINGYLQKTMDITEISEAIKLAFANEVYNNNLLNSLFFKQYLRKHKKSENLMPSFSEEEHTILTHLQLEKTTEEISKSMNLSKRSIELKRDKMREKAGVKTIAGLLLYAFKRGFID